MRFAPIVLLALTLYPALPAVAAIAPQQDGAAPESKARPVVGDTYKLTFVVRELTAGKVTGSRTYSSLYLDNRTTMGSIRAGDKVPIPTDNDGTQWSYHDVGVSIDFRAPQYASDTVPAGPGLLPLRVQAEVSSVSPDKGGPSGPSPAARQPVTRQEKWESTSVIELGKPTLLFSSDEPTADVTTQVELTAVKVK